MEYIHTLKCKTCQRIYKVKKSDDKKFNPQERCFQMDSGSPRCPGRIAWDSWSSRTPGLHNPPTPVAKAREPSEEQVLIDKMKAKLVAARLRDPKTRMIAYLYVAESSSAHLTNQEFLGKCGTKGINERGAIPIEIWNDIPDEWVVDEMVFGKNCAEVDALKKLFAQCPSSISHDGIKNLLSSCRFMAMDNENHVRGPCRGCRSWMKKHNIQAYTAAEGKWKIPA